MLNLINKTKFAISNEETRYFLNGLYFSVNNENGQSMLTFVGTDGHRLAKFSHYIDDNVDQISGVIIPKKTIYELSKLLSESDQDIEIALQKIKVLANTAKNSLSQVKADSIQRLQAALKNEYLEAKDVKFAITNIEKVEKQKQQFVLHTNRQNETANYVSEMDI